MRPEIVLDVEAIGRIAIVKTALEILRRTTGLRMALVARVTADSWTACAVLDDAGWGLSVGLELEVKTTYCRTVTVSDRPIFITHASQDPIYRDHPALLHYKIESYVAVPLRRRNGSSFGVLCALDPNPSDLQPEHIDTLRLLASLISHELEAEEMQQRLEQDLVASYEAARARDRLMGVLSHDLRTPLTSVVLGAQHLASVSRLAADDRRTAVAVLGSARRASRMVGDLLDFTRARLGGGIAVRTKQCDLAAIADKVVAEIRSTTDREIRLEIQGQCDGNWDGDRAAQVVSNLVSNAVTHASTAEAVRVRLCAHPEEVIVEVVNDAAPIAESDLALLFSPFERPSHNRGDSLGLGLGLFIVQQVMSAHGGTVTLTQSDGRVTTRVTWPRVSRA